MRYSYNSRSRLSSLRTKFLNISTAAVLIATSLGGSLPLFFSKTVFADAPINISNVSELRTAIENQADNQVWNIQSGHYGLTPFNNITEKGETGWYFPITANNITINGVGNPTIYGDSYTANGNWSTQNLVTIFGNHVTINGLTLMPKVEPNKTIEVLGDSATIENVTLTPNTLTNQADYANISDPTWAQDAKTWGGSIYYNNATGTQTLDNITIYNGGISVHAPGTTFNVSNVHFSYTSNVDWLNDYRFYVATPTSVINGTPAYAYHVNSTLNNFDSVLAAVGDPTTILGPETISLDSNISTTKQITLTKPVTLNGNAHTISPTFAKTDNSNNSALGIQANNVTVNNLVENGTAGTNLHGINVFDSTGVAINDVTVENNNRTGLNVDGSAVTVNNLTTANNGWDGVDVDKAGAVLTVNGISHHTEIAPDIYVDNASIGQVIDTNNQYSVKHPVVLANDSAYNLKPATPILTYPSNKSFINTNDFWFDWGNVTGAVSYEFQASQNPSTDGNGALNVNVWSGDYQHNQPTASTLHSVGASGTWYWQVRAVDAKGVKSGWSAVWKMTIDTTKPAAPTISYPSNNSFVSNIQKVTWNGVVDDFANPVAYIYQSSTSSSTKPDGSFVSPAFTSSALGTTQIPTLGTPEGTYYLHVQAIDAAGNKSDWGPVVKTTVDNTAPVVHITAPSSTLLRGTVNVNGTVTDVNPDHYYFVVKDSHGNVVAGPGVVNAAQVTAWSWDTTKVSDGTYTIDLEARDKAGNKDANSTATLVVKVDKTAPTTPVANPVAGNYQTAQNVTLASTDNNLDGIYYTTDGTTPTKSSTKYTSAINIDVDTTLKAIAYDKAGNTSNILTADYFIAPVISGEQPIQATTTSITLTWTTNQPATSRVIYDVVAHPTLGSAPNYGYLYSTAESDTGTNKTTNHSVTVTGLTAGTYYYFRTVSQGSPESVSGEVSAKTVANPAPATATTSTSQPTNSQYSASPQVVSTETANTDTPAPIATNTDNSNNGNNGDVTKVLGVSTKANSGILNTAVHYWWVLLIALVAIGYLMYRRFARQESLDN